MRVSDAANENTEPGYEVNVVQDRDRTSRWIVERIDYKPGRGDGLVEIFTFESPDAQQFAEEFAAKLKEMGT